MAPGRDNTYLNNKYNLEPVLLVDVYKALQKMTGLPVNRIEDLGKENAAKRMITRF
ncbi:hypothetical protein [Aminipila sp.]|uniref:hypothetical protein n=1 Tax=Aminipila sp. TaxID=2060095 RepID=UPI0028962F9F|nr:hypothetical protein [Aminipila sp.]